MFHFTEKRSSRLLYLLANRICGFRIKEVEPWKFRVVIDTGVSLILNSDTLTIAHYHNISYILLLEVHIV